MELKDWAIRILSADSLEEKLISPDSLTDSNPGLPVLFNEPTRPTHMGFKRRGEKRKASPLFRTQ